MSPRVRRSLIELDYRYRTGEDKASLENLVRAFRGVQQLPPDNPNSFSAIAGFHGEPFVEDPPPDAGPNWWGGYCTHGTVLFPTWHRVYLLRLEDALRSIPGCANVTLPYWDECLDMETTQRAYPSGPGPVKWRIIPQVVTEKKFVLDGAEIDNPLYSFTFQIAVADTPEGEIYTKPKGYKTVRYPLSGLVGTAKDREETRIHNEQYPDDLANVGILNGNVANWLKGTVNITPPPDTRVPDTTSAYSRYIRSLSATDYTVFSNITSAAAATKSAKSEHGVNNPIADAQFITSLEGPHNAIHLAVAGCYEPGIYDASPIPFANGDMGENETAGFDPIFYFHHCFVDYVFWIWQKKHKQTTPGSLEFRKGDFPGTVSPGVAGQPLGTKLNEDTPLYPFIKPDGTPYTTKLATDIVSQLGYDYAPGSLDPFVSLPQLPTPSQNIVALKRVHNISRAKISGSFVIRLYAKVPSGEEFEIGRDAILSRWKTAGCANCQTTLDTEALVPIHEGLHRALKGYVDGDESKITYHVKLDTRAHRLASLPGAPPLPELPAAELPLVEDL